MANTGLPSNLFSGGSVIFNTQPSVQFYAQLMQHQQAKRDALNQYYQNELGKTTSAGMRQQDITEPNGFSDQYNKLQQFYLQNRNALINPSKDGFKAQTQFNQMHSNLLNTVEASKRANEKLKQGIELITKAGQYPTDEDMDIIHRMGLPINDPNRKNQDGSDPDISQFSFTRIPPNPSQQEKLFQDAFGKPNTWIDANQNNYTKIAGTNQYNQPTKTGYVDTKTGQLDIPALQQKAQTYILNAPKSLVEDAERKWHDPTLYHIANEAYSKVFPNDIVDTPQKYLMGQALARATQVQQGYKLAQDYQQKQKDILNHIYINAALQGKSGQNYNVQDLQLPDGTTDLTKPLQGIKVNSTVTGKSFNSDNIKYNPATKEITYTDVLDDNKANTIPVSKFRTIISTINTVQDLKTFDNLIQNIDKSFTKPKSVGTSKNRPPLDSFIKNK